MATALSGTPRFADFLSLFLSLALLVCVGAQAHTFDKDVIVIYGLNKTEQFTITDLSGCTADVHAGLFNSSIISVSPTSAPAVATQTFTVTSLNYGFTAITVDWQGTDVGDPEGECTEINAHIIFVSVEKEAMTAANAVQNNATANDPISTANGELTDQVMDLDLGGPLPLRFIRYYASFLLDDGRVRDDVGANWTHNYAIYLRLFRDAFQQAEDIEVVYIRGQSIPFRLVNGVYTLRNLEKVRYQLLQTFNGFMFLDPRHGLIFTFDADGRLTLMEDRSGNRVNVTFQLPAPDMHIATIADGLGRSLEFTYSGEDLVQVSDQTGRNVQFSYTDGPNQGMRYLASAMDAQGNATTYSYTEAGNRVGLLVSATKPEGNTPFRQEYDSVGRVIRQIDSNDHATTLAYDTPGPGQTTVTDPLGGTTIHTHADRRNLTQYGDANGNSLDFAYDPSGHRTALSDRLGNTFTAGYDFVLGQPTSYRDSLNNQTTYSYTNQQRDGFEFSDLSGFTFPDGASGQLSLDEFGRPTTVTDPAGHTKSYTYDARGQVLSVSNAAGGTTTFTYNADATMATRADPFDHTTTYSYDALKRLQTITYADNASVRFVYDNNNRVTDYTDARGGVTHYEYDRNGRLVSLRDANNHTQTWQYDGNDRIIRATDGEGAEVTITYDALGRPGTIIDRAGNTHDLTYASQNPYLLASITDAAGRNSALSFDVEGQLTGISWRPGRTWQYDLDGMGRTIGLTSPLGLEQRYTYDALGRIISHADALQRTTAFSHDPRGYVSGITAPGGASTSYEWDPLGQLIGVTAPSNEVWAFTYDQKARLTTATDPLSLTTTYAYDARDRLSSVLHPDGATETLEYDASGNLIHRAYSDGLELTFAYDAKNRLLATTDLTVALDGRGGITNCNGLAMTRDAIGRIATLELAPGNMIAYHYNNRGYLADVADWLGGTTTFTYDEGGLLVSITRPNGVTTSYTYDVDDRLIGIQENSTKAALSSITRTLDAAGNVTASVRDVPLAPSVTEGEENYSYTAGDQLASATYDRRGRVTSDAARTYQWDGAARLTSLTEGGNSIGYTYDGADKIVTRTQGVVTRAYVWNYAFRLASISVMREGGSDQRYYVHTPDGTLLYSVDAGSEARHFYHYDDSGNTLCLTDDAAAVTDSYTYTPYGRVIGHSGTTENPFTFVGAYGVMQEDDAGTLYYMRARHYDAMHGRFLTRDRIRTYTPKSANPYQYAGQNPQRNADPTGA
ncbi:MAG: RHS repeat protein [Candidatus Hydrogenedentes bacterium]|nr:RHS repeat protein [Candidatus Hydrogenedentota bacterium]